MVNEPTIWVNCRSRRVALTVDQIGGRTDTETRRRGRRIQVVVRRSDAENGRWLFDAVTVGGERSGGPYRCRVRISPHTKNPESSRLSDKDIEVSCSCPAWRFNGPDYWSKVRRYLWTPTDNVPNLFPDWPKPGRGYSDGSFPRVRDPRGRHGSCKHVVAVLNLIKDYWAPTGGGRAPFRPQRPSATPRAFWGKLGIPDIAAYMRERYEGAVTAAQIADATAEALNEWYDEELFERSRNTVRPTQDEIMFDDVLREIGRNDRRKTKFLELFEDEIGAGREVREEEHEPEEPEEPEAEAE